MINKSDCMSILVRLEDTGINIDKYMRQLLISKEIPIDVLKFIIENQGIEVTNFYEMLRKKHNQSKSQLYTSIVDENAKQDIITTLTCLLTQIVLYSNKLVNKEQFIKEVRAEEITRVLNKYFASGSADECYAVLSLIKTDLLVLEALSGRRQLG